jgi:hypothetical protein
VSHAYNLSYLKGRDKGDPCSKPAQANNSQILNQKNPTENGAGGMVQVVECLPNKHEAPSSAEEKNENSCFYFL